MQSENRGHFNEFWREQPEVSNLSNLGLRAREVFSPPRTTKFLPPSPASLNASSSSPPTFSPSTNYFHFLPSLSNRSRWILAPTVPATTVRDSSSAPLAYSVAQCRLTASETRLFSISGAAESLLWCLCFTTALSSHDSALPISLRAHHDRFHSEAFLLTFSLSRR